MIVSLTVSTASCLPLRDNVECPSRVYNWARFLCNAYYFGSMFMYKLCSVFVRFVSVICLF